MNIPWPVNHSPHRELALSIAFSAGLLLAVAGCTTASSPVALVSTPSETIEVATPTALVSTSTPGATPIPCALAPLVVPPMPTVIPGYAEVDPATGLHVTGKVQDIDIDSYRLEVTGLVDHPLKLSYDDLRCMPRIEKQLTLTCPGLFHDTATWAGVPLKTVLDQAGVQPGALHIKFYSADGYSVTIPMIVDSSNEYFLAYELDGDTLPRLHGFPLRAVFPGLTGGYWIKWLVKIEIN